MSGAQSWSVKGIDPKVREAAREAAARQGMSLGEYLNLALAQGGSGGGGTPNTPQRPRSRIAPPPTDFDNEPDDWDVADPRVSDPSRLAQRVESIERRTQLAFTGLDRAVSTIDRSVLGLAARLEDIENVSSDAATRVAEALDHFRIAGETLSGKLEQAEQSVSDSRHLLDDARADISDVRARLEHQVSAASEIARRAEAAASFLTSEMENRDAAVARTLAEARTVAEEAARQAAEASADAVAELRRLQEEMSERLADAESSTRRSIASAIEEVRSESVSETRSTREALLEEVVRLESEISKRVGTVDQLKSEHAGLIARIERAESGARESTAGLRQAAGAAIADLRNAQLTLAARVKQVEDSAGGSGAVDLTDLRHAQSDIAERLAALESKTGSSPLTAALASFEARLASVENNGASDAKIEAVDQSLQRLAARIAETESTATTAIRTLEETVSSLHARVESGSAAQESEAVRALLEQRLDTMQQSVSQMVGEARTELQGQLQAALQGAASPELEGALTELTKRLSAAERRQAQTIEAISLEIRRMSESVDKRLRTVEARNDDAAASAVREELSRMSTTLEQRFDEIERREAAAFDRMGLEVGRLSERLEERVGAVENRSAQAIEHVGEQVARMAERFNQRHEMLSRELGERMIDSEERAGQRVAEAISSIMQRLAEVEAQSAEAIAPVQKAVSSVASKLERYESEHDKSEDDVKLAIPTPQRRQEDFSHFTNFDPEDYVSPRDAAQPVRAGPLPPLPRAETPAPGPTAVASDSDIYFAEDIDDLLAHDAQPTEEEPYVPDYKAIEVSPDDDLLIDDVAAEESETLAAPQEEDEDPFWTPDEAPPAFSTPIEEPAFELTSTAPLEDEPLFGEEPAQPPSKNDYLAAARRAAQAQAQTQNTKSNKKEPKQRAEPGPTPKLSLRGSSRVVLWGAAVAALAAAGGAYYLQQQNANGVAPTPTPPESEASPATEALTPEPETIDPAAAFETAPTDPFAAPPAEGAPAEGTPVAANGATTQPVVAGPLAPRNVTMEQAAQSGDLIAQYELALQRIAGGRTQEGVTMMRRAADRGFAMAQYRLAKLYERGEGVQADLNVARQWTERAAAAGNRRAMHDLGVYFARGEGAPLDEAAAFRWFRQAAELGVADSQYNLGVLYQQGRGVNAAPSEALFWFMVAARQGDQDAGARATALETQLPQAQVEQARARAQAFRPRAASAVANGEFGARAWAASARGGA